MVLGFSRFLLPVLLFGTLVSSVLSSPVRNDTSVISEINGNWTKNESSIHNPTPEKETSKFSGLRRICEQDNEPWLWIFSNASNLTMQDFGTNKEKNVIPARIHLCCRQDKTLRNGILVLVCDIVVALCGDPSASWCQTFCPCEKAKSHDSTNKRFQNFTVELHFTRNECQGEMATSRTRQFIRLYKVQSITQRGLFVKMPERMEKAKCCNHIPDICIFLKSHANKTILKSAQQHLKAKLDYDRIRDVEDYINQSITSLVVCVLIIIGIFLTVMTYNLWSSRKRYQDSLKLQEVEET